MSGIIGSKLNIRGSGRIAKLGTDGQILTSSGAGVAANYEDAAAGISWQAIETGSTMTAVAGEGYWVDTSSNACTITLPSSASVGDTIVFADYARYWGTNGIELDSNGLNYQGQDDTYDVEYGTDGQALRIVYMDATQGWIPTLDKAVADAPFKGNANGIFAYGYAGTYSSLSNIVSDAGVVATDVTGVGTARYNVFGCEYGTDKAICCYGFTSVNIQVSNLITNAGVVGTDVTGVGSARQGAPGATFGSDKGIFAYGYVSGYVNMSNLVSNVGVVATDTTGVGTARTISAATEYSANKDKAIFAYGYATGSPAQQNMSNLVSNTGVVSTDVTGVGSIREGPAACRYSSDKGIFGYGHSGSVENMTNLVSNVGVVGTDVTGVGTARGFLAGCEYGSDKGIMAYGSTGSNVAISNLVTNAGVVGDDVTGVGTVRRALAGCSFN